MRVDECMRGRRVPVEKLAEVPCGIFAEKEKTARREAESGCEVKRWTKRVSA